MRKSISVVAAVAMLLSACGNTVYGPPRLLGAKVVPDGTSGTRGCPADGSSDRSSTAINFTQHFYDLACASLRAPTDTVKAHFMIDHGVMLNRMRCNDFFRERAANQMRQRVIRGTVTPVSALLTGIIGVTSFATDADRQEAIQILGIAQNATTAGLELYESEFLFGADNVNAVRTLTMRALDEHGARILAENVGFYAAARHLIDHQMICTPANILELAQTAIREGRITPMSPLTASLPSLDADRATISTIASNLRMTDLTADQLGAFWWLIELAQANSDDQNTLKVVRAKLSGLPVNPIIEAGGRLSIDRDLVRSFEPLFRSLSPRLTSGFQIVKRLLLVEIAKPDASTLLDRTKSIVFELPRDPIAPTSRSQEVVVAPASN